MSDPDVMLFPCVSARPAGDRAGRTQAVLNLSLRRRRSKIPWMYAVYHAPRDLPDEQGLDNTLVSAEAVAERETR